VVRQVVRGLPPTTGLTGSRQMLQEVTSQDPDYDPTADAWASNLGTDWYRSPSWGGGLVWNPQYGFQSRQDIKGMGPGRLFKSYPEPRTDWTQYMNLNGVTGLDNGSGGGAGGQV